MALLLEQEGKSPEILDHRPMPRHEALLQKSGLPVENEASDTL